LSLRARLAEATREAHERLHGHPGFAAAAAGRIGRADYADLLARLYGFHRPLEAGFSAAPSAMAEAISLPLRRRAPALADSLAALGWEGDPEALARCAMTTRPGDEPAWLGALYVTEGATLGGVEIGRAMARAGYKPGERRFFEAYGDQRSALWRSLLARLESHAADASAAASAERAARAQFLAFESWMNGWRGAAAQLGETIAAL
jgi:heme oxygenase